MGNYHQTKARRKQYQQDETSKKFLSESKKFLAGEYSAFQFIADANNYKANQIKELSYLQTELQSKQVLDYALDIYSEFLPQRNTINAAIYNPFLLLKAQNEGGSTSDFLKNQTLFINDFIHVNSIRDREMTNTNNKAKISSNPHHNRHIDDIENHVSSIIQANEEEGNKPDALPNDNHSANDNDNDEGNEDVDEISNILLTDDIKKSNNNLGQLKTMKGSHMNGTIKPDDQKTVTSLLKQMNFQKGKEGLQKGTLSEKNDLVSPIMLRRMEVNDNKQRNTNETSQSFKSGRDYNIDIIKTDNTIEDRQLNKVGKMSLVKTIKKGANNNSNNMYSIKPINNIKNNYNQSKGMMQVSSSNDYKICITEPTKRSHIQKQINTSRNKPNNHQHNQPNQPNQCNQSHLCKRYFKLKKEIEEEQIIQQYCSQRSNRNHYTNNNNSYQITIDLRDINEENNPNEDNPTQDNPHLNKLITFSPNEDHTNNMMLPSYNNRKLIKDNTDISHAATGKSSKHNIINKKMTKRGSCPAIPSFFQLKQMNNKKKQINYQRQQSSAEDDSSTYLHQNADQSKSNLSMPKVPLNQHHDLSYVGPLINIDKDINKHKKNQIKKVKQKMYNEFISNLKLPQYQIDNQALNPDHKKTKTSDLNHALNNFKANNRFLFEYTEEEKKIEEKMKQFDI